MVDHHRHGQYLFLFFCFFPDSIFRSLESCMHSSAPSCHVPNGRLYVEHAPSSVVCLVVIPYRNEVSASVMGVVPRYVPTCIRQHVDSWLDGLLEGILFIGGYLSGGRLVPRAEYWSSYAACSMQHRVHDMMMMVNAPMFLVFGARVLRVVWCGWTVSNRRTDGLTYPATCMERTGRSTLSKSSPSCPRGVIQEGTRRRVN